MCEPPPPGELSSPIALSIQTLEAQLRQAVLLGLTPDEHVAIAALAEALGRLLSGLDESE
jgi:hypothetical protein